MGLDNDHSIAVYDWRHKCLVASGPSDKEKVYAISFCMQPTDEKGGNNNVSALSLVSCGQNHIKFWQVQGGSFKCQKGLMNGKADRQSMMCAVAVQEYVVTGSVDGSVYLWKGHR